MADQPEALFVPFGGMNQDDSLINPSPGGEGRSAFEGGGFRYALNFRTGSTREDSLGDGENIRDSLLVTVYKQWNGSAWVNGTKPNGTNTPVGECEDSQLRKTFIIYHNSGGNHSIVEYRPAERAVYELLQWTGLNLSKTYVSLSRAGNYLIIAGKGNKPRIIDYTNIFSLKSTLGNKFTEYHISFAKWAPVAPPIPLFQGDIPMVSVLNKKLTTGLFQFTYRYIYVGGFRSAWSPVSNACSNLYRNTTIDSIWISMFGLIYNSVATNTPNNHNEQEFYQVVNYIEIAYRSSQVDIWRLFKRVKVDKTGSIDNTRQIFLNNVAGGAIDPEDISRDFDDVPLESRSTEVIDSRPLFGNNLHELDFLDDNDFIQDAAVYESNQVAWAWYGTGHFTSLDLLAENDLTLRNKIRQQSFKSRGTYQLGIEFKDESGKKSLVYTCDALTFNIPESRPHSAFLEPQYALGFKIKDAFKPPLWATSYQILRTNCQNIDYFLFGIANKFIYLVDDTSSPIADNVTTPEEIQAVQREFFDNPAGSSFTLAQRLQGKYRKTKESGTSANTTDLGKASRVYIDINNWYNAAANTGSDVNFPLNKLYYEYRQGDRVRFYGSAVTSPTSPQIVIYDLPIVEFTGRGIIIEKPSNLLWLPQRSVETEGNWIIEVYRPKKSVTKEETIFYEMGEWYPVTNPKTVNRDFAKKDFTWGVPANVTSTVYKNHYSFHRLPIFMGDVHTVIRNFYYNYVNATNDGQMLTISTPSMNPDKELTYDRWERGNGRPNVAYSDAPVVAPIENEICFGGKFLQDAVFNNINQFRSRDRFIYPQEYGSITEMINTTSYQVESAGSILLVLGTVKSFSIYVNRTTLEDLSGRTSIALSDKVLGAYNSLLGDNGCLNPESISVSSKGHVYWWDQFGGGWIRYGRDGNTDIAGDYKMGAWFRGIAEILEPLYSQSEELRPWIVSEFDQFHKELITLMGDVQVVPSYRGYTDYRGMIFNEKVNQWKYAHNYNAHLFTRVNNEVLALINNNIYILEAGTGYGTLLGTKVACKVEPVFNINSRDAKLWMRIKEVSSHRWGIEKAVSEYFGSRASQQTNLLASKLEEKEFAFYSEILNDVNTPNTTDPELAAMDGDKMRSRVLKVLLKLDDTVVVRSLLHQVLLGYIDSPKNS